MISKIEFVKIINQLIEFHKAEYGLNKIMSAFCSDYSGTCFDKEETIIVDLVQEIFKDKENDWIGYCLYELNDFKEYKDGCVKDENGEIIKLSNAGELYDLLIENMEV